MNNQSPQTFEERLLTSLRAEVAASAANVARQADRPKRPVRRFAFAGAVAAATALAVWGANLGGASPAFAIEPTSDGGLTVTVSEVRDAEALEAALAEKGVKADITMAPEGFRCAERSWSYDTTMEGWTSVQIELGDDNMVESLKLTLSPEIVAADQTHVWEFWREGSEIHSLGGLAVGEVPHAS